METFDTIGDWIEETFGKNEEIEDRFSCVHFDRVTDEFDELTSAVDWESVDSMNPIANEAADVVIALAGMCRRYGIDLQQAVDEKMKINREREWDVYSNGTGRHITSNKNWSMLDE